MARRVSAIVRDPARRRSQSDAFAVALFGLYRRRQWRGLSLVSLVQNGVVRPSCPYRQDAYLRPLLIVLLNSSCKGTAMSLD